MAIAGQLVARGALPLPEPGAPGVFALADPSTVEAWLSDGGMTDVEVGRVDFQQRYDSFDAFWQEVTDLAAPVAEALREIGDEATAEVRSEAQRFMAEYATPDGSLVLPAATNVARARA
jgi:hypothetical protein